MSISGFSQKHPVSEDYQALASEFISRCGIPKRKKLVGAN